MAAHMKPTVGRKFKAFLPESGEILHVGVDVHRRSYAVAIWSNLRGHVAQWTQPAEPGLLVERLSPLTGSIRKVVYEAGPTGFSLVRALRAAGIPADVIATSMMLKTVSRDSKSDRMDCRRLAEHAAKELFRLIRVPTEEEEQDRQLLRLREQMVRKHRQIRQQIKSFLLTHGIAYAHGLKTWTLQGLKVLRELEMPELLRRCFDVLLDEEEHARAQVQRINEAVKKLMATVRHRKKVEVLRSVPGVGVVTAMTFQTELLGPERFNQPGEVAKMIGLAPLVQESGERRREGSLIKAGNWRLRTILVEAAWRWVRQDEGAKTLYRRCVRNTGDGKKAIVAVARKLAIMLWRMVTREEMYRGRVAAA